MGKLKGAGLVLVGVLAGVLLSLNLSAIAQREVVARGPLPYEDLRTFTEVFGRIKADYVEPVEDKRLITEAITGMLTGLDPHSAYLDQDAFKELQVGTQGEFGGLGIEVGMEDGFVKVVSPIEDTPAYRAGLKPGDLIIKIDDTPTKGMTLNDAVKKMRGAPKSSVRLTILRKGEQRSFDVTLVRDKIRVQSVKSKMLEPGYGYVRVSQFQEHTVDNLVKHVNGLYKDGPLKGLVLDLRNDPGGLLNGAIGISAAFLQPNVVVVSTDGRTPDAKRKFMASPDDYVRGRGDDVLRGLPPQLKNVPMVVLVNGGSASASEIVAGALQDHKRATIIGTQTFGKGSVQTILPLSNSTAIKLTTARYYTPSGRSIQAKGIVPDIEVEEPGAPRDRVREADLQRHLSNDREKDDPKAVEQQPVESKSEPQSRADEPEKDQKDQKDTKDQKPIELGSPDDFQLKQAINHLKGLPVLARIELDAKADTSPASTQAKAEAPASHPVGKAQPKKN
ncbi:MAG: S41 family peptidase [Burkholderiales bacterium]